MTFCVVPPILVLGAGSYGTALAIFLAKKGYKVFLWGHNSSHVQKLKQDGCNNNYLPDIFFPPSLSVVDSLSVPLSVCQNVFIAVPSRVFNNVLVQIKSCFTVNTRIILATKGLEKGTGRLLQDVVFDVLGRDISFAVMSGPTFAREIALGLPTAVTLVATDAIFCADLKKILHCNKNFRVYCHSDFVGVQLAGVVKNVIAIAVGISDGLNFGSGSRTVLITRGLAEMSRLGKVMGAQSSIFVDMAGLGDLILTCTDNQSRNRRFGILLGKGFSIFKAREKIGQIIEGICNVQEVRLLSIKYDVDMPITEQVYRVLYQNKSVHDAVVSLLNRT